MNGESRSGTLRFLAAALASAISSGLIVITSTVLVADVLRSRSGSGTLELRLYWIAGGTLAGVLLAGFLAWRLLEPITSAYRRGGFAMVAAFATVLLMLICIPINQILGHTGLFLLLGSSCIAAVLLARRAVRLGAQA